MPFCPSCGATVEGSFCGACGKAVNGGPPLPSSTPSAAGLQDNVAGALCYLLGLITGILFLVLEPYSRNRAIRFHAFQSIFLNVAWIAVWIAFTAVTAILGSILGGILALLTLPLSLAFLVLWIVLMVKAFNGGKMVLPVIGPMAEKQAG